MAGLSAAATLEAWELAEPLGPLDRALALLWAAGERGDLAALPLAERDRRLLALRDATFGESLDCVASCPECGAASEFALNASNLAQALTVPAPETIERAGASVALRPLDSRDLAAAAALPETEVPVFLRRRACPSADTLPPELIAEIDSRIELREGAGELRLALACAHCDATWQESFDIAGHLWTELAAAARRVLAEVAEIAAAFGWSEAAILALSETRRRSYLTLARGG